MSRSMIAGVRWSTTSVARLGIRLSVGCPLTIREPWGLPCLPWHRFSVGWPLIIQTILLYPSGAVWTDEASNVSRPDPSGAVQGDAEHSTRNRKVVGSNPTSGSKTAGQSTYTVTLSLVLLASLIILCVCLASGRARPPLAPLESVWLIQRPSMGPFVGPLRAKSWRADDWAGPAGRGRFHVRCEKPGCGCAAISCAFNLRIRVLSRAVLVEVLYSAGPSLSGRWTLTAASTVASRTMAVVGLTTAWPRSKGAAV